jgi:hypothetical protein
MVIVAFPGLHKQQAEAVQHDNHRAPFMPQHADGERDVPENGEPDEHDHRSERHKQVLADDPSGVLAQPKRGHEVFQPVVHQHDFRLLFMKADKTPPETTKQDEIR